MDFGPQVSTVANWLVEERSSGPQHHGCGVRFSLLVGPQSGPGGGSPICSGGSDSSKGFGCWDHQKDLLKSMALQAAMVHPTVRIASFDDWKVVEEKAWVVEGFFGLHSDLQKNRLQDLHTWQVETLRALGLAIQADVNGRSIFLTEFP